MSDEIKPPKPSEILELALKGSAAVLGGLYATGLIVASPYCESCPANGEQSVKKRASA